MQPSAVIDAMALLVVPGLARSEARKATGATALRSRHRNVVLVGRLAASRAGATPSAVRG